jgi:hypothetical protein
VVLQQGVVVKAFIQEKFLRLKIIGNSYQHLQSIAGAGMIPLYFSVNSFTLQSMEKIKYFFLNIIFLLVFFLQGCSPILAEKAQRTPTLPITPVTQPTILEPSVTPKIKLVGGAELASIRPGEPKGEAQIIYDQSSASTAAEKKAFGGDEYSLGRFERPFTRQMEYIPGLDILRAELNRPGDNWAYFTIVLEDVPLPPPALYGVELDLNIDGRGDLLVQVSTPTSKAWSESGIKVWWDSDGDVGGRLIGRSDSPAFRGSGYETLKIDAANGLEPGKVWSRQSITSEHSLQIAVFEDLVGGKNGNFTWKPYADGVPFPPSQYDINDYYPLEQAGSPLIGERDYPLKAVNAIDNTCRGLSGLVPTGREQGVCPQ